MISRLLQQWLLLICLAVAMARKLPQNFDLDEAIKLSKEREKKDRQQRQRRRLEDHDRAKQGLPPVDSNKEMWQNMMSAENGTATGPSDQGFNRTVKDTMYIVSATTPVREKHEEDRPRGHLLASKQPPFVHWVCYRGLETKQDESMATEQLTCCQEIFRAMEQAPEGLCWRADIQSCGSGPTGPDLNKLDIGENLHYDGGKEKQKQKAKEIHATSKAEFMSHCTNQIGRVPSDAELNTAASASSIPNNVGVPPRWSLVIAPDVMADKPTLSWRQFILLQDGKFGTWIKKVSSPMRLGRPLRVLSDSEIRDGQEAEVPMEIHPQERIFGAALVSRLVESEQDDEFRDFVHTLTPDVSKITRISEDENYQLDFTILLALPNEMRLPKPRKGRPLAEMVFSKCRSSCGSPSCTLEIVQAPMIQKKKVSIWGQQTVVGIIVHIDNMDASEAKKKRCEFSWRTSLWLEDEEPLLVAPPLLYQGALQRRGEDNLFIWDGLLNPASPLLTDLEERERLEDLWKMEL